MVNREVTALAGKPPVAPGVVEGADQRLAAVVGVVAVGVDEVREQVDRAHAVIHVVRGHAVGLHDPVHSAQVVVAVGRGLRDGEGHGNICPSPIFFFRQDREIHHTFNVGVILRFSPRYLLTYLPQQSRILIALLHRYMLARMLANTTQAGK